jgi:hypothetical protein
MEGMASVPVDELIKMNDAMRAMEENKITICSSRDCDYISHVSVNYVGKDEAITKMEDIIKRQKDYIDDADNKIEYMEKYNRHDTDNYRVNDNSFRSRLHFLFTGRLE